MELTEEEKFFVAHYVLGSYQHVKPICGKYISLFSYLDQTDESVEIQEIQIEQDDWYFAELLARIYKDSTEPVWNSVFKKLDREGFFENEDFYNKFLAVATWLYSKNSLRYFFEAGKIAHEIYSDLRRNQQAKIAEEEKRRLSEKQKSHVSHKSAEELAQDRINAAKLLNKSVNRSKVNKLVPTNEGDWGLKRRPKLNSDGNDWREQL